MSRVLVTGASGFIGRHALPALLEAGYEVHAVARSAKRLPPVPGVRWHHLDLLDVATLRGVLREIAPISLLHFAWEARPGRYWTAIENVRWVQSTLELALAFAEAGGRRVVCAGTCAEYDWRWGSCHEDLTPLAPTSLYGASKHAAQVVLRNLGKEIGLSIAWGRIFFPYGPHEHPERLIPSVTRALLNQEPVECSHGRQIRDLLHVGDVADAFVTLLRSDAEGALNIGSGCPVALRDALALIGDRLKGRHLILLGARPEAAQDPPVLLPDMHRLFDEIGWRPRFTLEEGLDDTIAWWRERLLA